MTRHPLPPVTGRSLLDLFPIVAATWHPERNQDITPDRVRPGSEFRAWWHCLGCGSDFEMTVANRVRGSGYRPCGLARMRRTKATPAPQQSLADQYPKIAYEVDPNHNDA
ncbi:zinc-ribbon domain-containing protein [Streptomyces cyaneofuscatus]|uniref:zinc-ribbon domain-containing protein n=1 Tax=Streptomyces cyaneofuscatus TaxID=66883 RepID=UPI003805F599